MTPGLQWLRQNLHCHFGSVLTISEISMLPDSLIAFFDTALNALNDCFWSRSFWTACFCGWRAILRISWRMFKVSERFHRFFRNARDTEVNIRIVCCKVKLVHCITTFEMMVFLHCVLCLLSFRFPWVVRDFGHAVLPSTQVSPVYRKNLVLLATHQQQSLELRVSSNSLDWFWGIGLAWKNRNELFLQVTVIVRHIKFNGVGTIVRCSTIGRVGSHVGDFRITTIQQTGDRQE